MKGLPQRSASPSSVGKVVAGRLGDDPKTVLGTYAHLLPHSDAMAADAVAAALVDNPLTPEALVGEEVAD